MTLPPAVVSEEAPSESGAQTTEKTDRTQKDLKSTKVNMIPQAALSIGMPRRITPVQVKSEVDVKPRPLLATQYLPDTMLKAMEGEGDELLQILRVFCGQDPLYDLTKDDDELKEAFGLIQEDLLPTEHEEPDADDLSVATVDMYEEIDSKEVRELLVKLTDAKTKEAQILSDLAVVVNAEDLPSRQVGQIAKSVLEHERVCLELKYIIEEYNYQATHMILQAGHHMRQIYNFNMGKVVKMLSIEKLTEKYRVNPMRLFGMLKGSKYGCAQKSVTKGMLLLDIDTEVDAATKSKEQAVQQARLMTRKAEPVTSGAEVDEAGEAEKSQEETFTTTT